MKRVISILFCSFLAVVFLNGQVQLGLRLDNYAGINGIFFNPAAPMTSSFGWDANLAGASAFFYNNYAFIEQSSLFDLTKAGDSRFILAFHREEYKDIPGRKFAIDFYQNDRRRHLLEQANVTGPSFFVRINDQHSVGFFSRARQLGNARNVDTDFSYYSYNRRPFFDPFEAEPFQMNLIGWSELGLNYLLQLPANSGLIGIGVSAKLLQGWEAAYLDSPEPFELTKLPGDSLRGQPFTFEYGLTTSNLNGEFFDPAVKGRGVGFDIGFLYTIQDGDDGYRWKFGAALLDIGIIRFDEAAQQHRTTPDDLSEIGWEDYMDFRGPKDVLPTISRFSEQILGDAGASLVDDQFSMTMPSTLTLQADYRLNDYFYLNGTVVQGFPPSATAAHMGSLFAVTPRLETPWFGASMPVSLYQMQELRFGLSLRMGFLFIGTDDLGSVFGSSRLNSADLYFALKLWPFWNKGGKGGRGGSPGRNGKNNEPGCYSF
jgi:hypothetical protein